MKKIRRLVSINLVLVLLLTLLPLQAFAATNMSGSSKIEITGKSAYEEGITYTPSATGWYTFEISATKTSGSRSYPTSSGTLAVYKSSTSLNGFTEYGSEDGYGWTTYSETVYLTKGVQYTIELANTDCDDKTFTVTVTETTVPTLTDGFAQSFSADAASYFRFITVNTAGAGLGGVYAITLGAGGYAQVYVRAEDDTSWTFVGDTDNNGEVVLKENTTYYIRIQNGSSATGSIKIERILGTDLDMITTKSPSVAVSPYDSDVYYDGTCYFYDTYVAFVPSVSGYYGITLSDGVTDENSLSYNYSLYVYNSNGSSKTSGYEFGKDGSSGLNTGGAYGYFYKDTIYYLNVSGSSYASSVTVSATLAHIDKIGYYIACPVDASVTLNGETLSSENLSIGGSATASFGTVERVSDGSTDGAILFSLDYNENYELFIWGIGDGTMSLDISYYIDDILIETRSFENIGISTETKVTGDNFDYKDNTVIYVYDGTSTTELVVKSPFADTEEDGGSTSSGSSTTHYYADASYKITVDSTKNGSVSVSDTRAYEGDTVTLTVTPDDGYELDSLTVTNVSTGKTVKVTQKSDTKYTFTMPDSKVTVEATFVKVEEAETEVLGTLIKQDPKTPFTDISTSRFKSAIAEVYAAGLMNGVTETTFDPEGTLTRAMVVTTLYRLAGGPAVTGSSSFSDVADGQWYTEAVIWAAQNGVVEGYTDGTFQPDTAVTREQLATILYRYASRNGIYVGNTFALDGFTDCDAVHDYAVTAMEWAVANSVLVSRTTAMLDATEAATRAEVAQALSTLIS